MNRNELTSSNTLREIEIQNYSLIFEPSSKPQKAYNLYSTPLGQIMKPTLILNSGSLSVSDGVIQIEKELHVFEREQDASLFITEIGLDNVSAVTERVVDGKTLIEVHLINFPKFDLSMEILDLDEKGKYKMEIYRSGSDGLEEVGKKVVYDSYGRVVNDTYLKFFEVETD